MTVALVFRRFGPYHLARLAGARARGAAVVGVELSAVDGTYAWERREHPPASPITTVFVDRDVEKVAPGEVFRAVGNALSRVAPTAVAVPGWAGAGALAALAWCCVHRVPAVLMSESTADDKPRVRWQEALKRRTLRLFSSALVGGAAQADYAAMLGMPRQRIFTGYDVVDNDHFAAGAEAARAEAPRLRAELGLPERYFLASSRFVGKKNLPRLVDAYARYLAGCPSDAWDLVLLGDGALRPALEEQVRSLGLGRHVHLPGFMQYGALPAFYGLAGAFVHASTTEQWGLVVNEAMAAGLPVIVSRRCGCAPDLVEPERNGLLFDPHDVDALANCLRRVGSDDCDREAMGEASRAMIGRWTPRTFAEGLARAVEAGEAAPRPRAASVDRALLWALAHH